jgi:signal transduction histidine kinase
MGPQNKKKPLIVPLDEASVLRKFAILFIMSSIIPMALLYFVYLKGPKIGMIAMVLMVAGVLVGFFSIRSLLTRAFTIAKKNRDLLAPFLNPETVKEINEGQNELTALSHTFSAVIKQFDNNINELKKKNEKLEALDHLKDDFVNNVSHEFRLPLTIIQESLRQIAEGMFGDVNEEQRRYLNMSLKNTESLKTLVDNMLDISKIKKGKLELFKKHIDLGAIIKEVVFDFSPKARQKGLEIKVDLHSPPLETLADKDKITQVLINLVGNAYKFTDKGLIEISALKNNGFIECSIADTGIGMSPKDLTYLFSDFYQISRWDGHQEKGTGLGLVIAKSIIELHNGTIHVESKEGKGTKFTFTLPIVVGLKGSAS